MEIVNVAQTCPASTLPLSGNADTASLFTSPVSILFHLIDQGVFITTYDVIYKVNPISP